MPSKVVLKVTKLRAGYETRTILNDVSFTVRQGEIVGIIGANGAGKSTLLKTMRGILPLVSGQVEICGKNTATLSEREFALSVAYLQQQVEVSFGYSVREIVLTGRYPYLKWWEGEGKSDEEIADFAMEYTGVKELAARPVTELSGGQRQRVYLAKVLAQKTPLLFLDEPTTGLDIVYQEEIFRFAKALAEAGKTVLMVVHELNLAAKFCSRLLLVGGGGILADGSPQEVLTDENLTKAYGVAVNVVPNPLTGGVEVTTVPKVEELERKEYLKQKICAD